MSAKAVSLLVLTVIFLALVAVDAVRKIKR